MGDAPSGEVQLRLGRGRTERKIDLRDARIAMFEPLITNATGQALDVTVNFGLGGARSCQCRVEPGAVRSAIGFYPLFRNSTVRATLPDGRSATFRDLGPAVDPGLLQVGLRFEDRDFK
jgi:hypothetical protein